ncbi:MAG: alkylhydroperoxidase family enzyme [Hyphomicrobiaceae bacterium]
MLPLEDALLELARRAHEQPARLTTTDLDPLRKLVGDDALDFAMVLGGFHHINRIADLLHVDSEALPESLRRFDFMRRLGVRMGARMMGRMDLANRAYDDDYESAVSQIVPLLAPQIHRTASELLSAVRVRPKIVEALRMALEDRLRRSTVSAPVRARVARVCAEALPSTAEEASGFHPRPSDPVDAFAFVGTRYPARTTEEMIQALRDVGYDDEGILDLAIAIADANLIERLQRLLGLDASLFAFCEVEFSEEAVGAA